MKQNLGLLGGRARRGASVLIAILVFFLAAISGTVALTMSASNAGKATHEREEQQAYLLCMSAAHIILDRLSGLVVTFRSKWQQAPIFANEVTTLLTIEKNGKAEEWNDKADLFLKDDNFLNMLKQYALNSVITPVEFVLYLDNHADNKVTVKITRAGSNFNFDFWVTKSNNKDYQMSMSQILAAFDDDIIGGAAGHNFKEREDGYFYRTLKFNVDEAEFNVGNLV